MCAALQCEKPSAKSGPTPNGSASPSNNPGTNRDTANKDSSTGASQPQQGQQAGSPSKVQGAGQQCGGLGGDCSTLGGCVRGALPGLKCAPGLTCREQNKFYWEVRAALSGCTGWTALHCMPLDTPRPESAKTLGATVLTYELQTMFCC